MGLAAGELDAIFADAKAVYLKSEQSIRQGNPSITPEQLNVQLDRELIEYANDRQQKGMFSKEILDLYRKAILESTDADGYARNITESLAKTRGETYDPTSLRGKAMSLNPNPTGGTSPLSNDGAAAVLAAQDDATKTAMKAVLSAGPTQGSDQAFEDRIEAAYKKIEDSIRQGNPNITQAELNAQIDVNMRRMIDEEVKGKRVSQEIADAYKKALKDSQDADGFARILTQERDKLTAASPAAAGGMDAMNEKMMAMIMGFMDKIMAMFGLGGPQKPGLTGQFAGVSGQPQKPVPQPGDPNFMGPMPEMVGPPAPAVTVAAPAVAAPSVAVASPVSPGGPMITTDLASAPAAGEQQVKSLSDALIAGINSGEITKESYEELQKQMGALAGMSFGGVKFQELAGFLRENTYDNIKAGNIIHVKIEVITSEVSAAQPTNITAANDIDFATVTDGSRPAASFQASIQPSPVQQLLATPVASTAFTTIVPAANEPFAFDIGQSNQLRNDRFAAAVQPSAFTLVDPRAPAVDVGVVAKVGDPKTDASNDARALGFGT